MELTIWSLLGEESSGSVRVFVDKTITGAQLLRLFCAEKGIQVKPEYILCKKGNLILNASKTLEQENICDGDVIMFTIGDKEHDHSYFTNSWWMIMGLTLLIGALGLAYSLYLYLGPVHIPKKFGIVIDAGSTHSHLYVFSWHSKQLSTIEDIQNIHECYMPGGITHYSTSPNELTGYFLPCLKEAEKYVPVTLRKHTPLILGATAGMRILRQYDREGAELILSSIRHIFSTKTEFYSRVKDVFIVSGEQEGIDGWTAVNYLFQKFLQRDDAEEKYFSTLDLGGASVQVSTALNGTSHWPTFDYSIFNETYSICSRSFLCYGITKAHYRYEYLLANPSHGHVVANPCLPKGVNATFTKKDKMEPCILSNKKEAKNLQRILPGRREWNHIVKYKPNLKKKIMENPDHYLNGSYGKFASSVLENNGMTTKNSEILYILEGSSNATLCKEKIQILFNFKLCEKTFVFGDCLSHKRIPPYSGELVGFSAVFFRVFPLIGIGKGNTLDEFEAAVIRVCSKSYKELEQIYPDLSEILRQDFCFDAMYVYLLLTDGLGITEEKWNSILFAKEIRNQDVEWALGLILNRTSDSPVVKINETIDVTSFALLVILFASCLLTSLLFLINIFKTDRKNKSYRRVLNEENERRPFLTE